MQITRSGAQPSGKGPAEYLTGTVRWIRSSPRLIPARVAGASGHVRAGRPHRPGTRIRFGQTLIVTSGLGWVQREGGPVEEVRPGDVVWFPPGEKHWHGATRNHRT